MIFKVYRKHSINTKFPRRVILKILLVLIYDTHQSFKEGNHEIVRVHLYCSTMAFLYVDKLCSNQDEGANKLCSIRMADWIACNYRNNILCHCPVLTIYNIWFVSYFYILVLDKRSMYIYKMRFSKPNLGAFIWYNQFVTFHTCSLAGLQCTIQRAKVGQDDRCTVRKKPQIEEWDVSYISNLVFRFL